MRGVKLAWRALVLAAIAIAAPALAADLALKAPPAYMPPPVYNWGGFYYGLNAGYGFGGSNWTSTGGSTGTFNTNGGLVGSTIGYNVQTGPYVFGVEGDLDYANINGSTGAGCAPVVALPAAIGTITGCSTTNDWIGTIRGRLGYAWDRVLLYGTAGAAFGDIKATTIGTGSGIGSVDTSRSGWTAGAGVEYALAQHWTVKAEYLFVGLPNGSWSCPTCGTAATVSVSSYASLLRVGLNYKFGY